MKSAKINSVGYSSMQPVLFTFCAANELFFASLYMLFFDHGYLSKRRHAIIIHHHDAFLSSFCS